MTQKINLNASPYYDDYDSAKNFHKVLYKPGFPVQARELTSQQSILQNQIEKFGDHIFKDGSVVIPGGIAFDNQFSAVKLNSTNFNTDISIYIKNYLGKKIIGSNSGIEAIVKFIALPDGVNVDDVTLYVTYLSADKNSEFNTFTDGEALVSDESVVYGNTTITANTPFASLLTTNSTAIGSAAFISQGVYFIRGFFVNVADQTIILDHYSNNSSYRVGLQINELLVNAKEDDSLYDNAKGFTNFAAPGADRLKIELILTKKLLTDKNDTDFVELMRIDEGKIKVMQSKSDYNKIRDWIAERTYEESGDYSVDPFNLGLFNSLNDNLGNNGLFLSDDTTDSGNEPSDDLMCLKISAGQAYVRGYDIEKTGTTIIDVEKPRDVGIRSDVGVGFEMGNVLKLNNVTKGLAIQGSTIKLFDNFNSTGLNIGSARVYAFNLEDAPYTGSSTRWELRLFDIQTNTDIVLNESLSSTELPADSFIKGKSSGASGFAVSAGDGTSNVISVNGTSGNFVTGEQIQINGIDFPRTIGITTAYHTQSIKSIDDGINFKADVVPERLRLPNNIVQVSITGSSSSAGIATAVSGTFSGLRPGSVITYRKPGAVIDTFNEVKELNSDGTIDLISTPNVTGLRDGELSTTTITVSAFGAAPIVRGSGALYAQLDNTNVGSMNLTNSKIKISAQLINQPQTNNTIPITASNAFTDIPDVIFETFDQERYSLFDTATGAPEQRLGNDTFIYGSGGSSVTLTDIATSGNKNVNVTLLKNKIQSKLKEYTRSEKLIVNRSRNPISGSNAAGNGGSISDGLIFDRRYGLRVQDEEISLNLPDVVKFLSVYESTDTNAPTLDKLIFPASVDTSTNAVKGENIVGTNSNVVARVVNKSVSNEIEIVYLSSGKFTAGESVEFQESNISTTIQSISIGNYKNITNSFTLDKGQEDEFYDYSRLVRNKNVPEPSGQLLIVFDYYSVPSDAGDVFTVESYDQDRFSKDIPILNSGLRATDTLDFRPRVSVYNPSTDTGSPFNFSSRDFGGGITRFLTPNETSTVSYEFFLPRIDKVYLNKFGEFVYEKGISSTDPKPPTRTGELMELATITLPAYLYNTQSSLILLNDNRRFTMRDIGNIESRVTNLEETTTLSLLELNAQTLQVLDEEGRNRFKTGFFVDPFKNYNFINRDFSTIQINPQSEELISFRTRDTLASQIKPSSSLDISQLDFNTDFELFDSNVKKTGDFVTLNYEEVEWITQPYATRTGGTGDIMNVNPYEIPVFSADIELDPRNDFWTRTIQLPSQTIRQTGTNGTTSNVSLDVNLGSAGNPLTFDRGVRRVANPGKAGTTVERTIFQGEVAATNVINESIQISNVDTTIQNNLVSSSTDDFMRSRNIQFVSSGFANHLRLYLYLDGQKIFDIIPKLLEIVKEPNGTENGSNGTFSIGETVEAYDGGNLIAKFRICRPDHKFGGFANPTETYLKNPYTKDSGLIDIPNSYTPSISILNIDTKSLSEEAQGDYYGYVVKNAKLLGTSSGATAYVKEIRLVTDDFGDLIGSCFIRDPHAQPAPTVKIATGSKNFKLTSSKNNENVAPAEKFGVVAAETRYDANGTIEQWQETVTLETNTNTVNVSGDISGNIALTETVRYYDPLAQTFVVGGNVDSPSAVGANKDLNGVFITSVEVYFASVDTITNSPITCEIRTTTGDARPSRTLLGRSKTLRPRGTDANGNEVTLIEFDSESASKPTKFTFPDPIYLAPGESYSFVLVAPQSTAYNVWTGRQGGVAVNASSIQEADSGASLIYSTQYAAGAIFKSQNGALWTEDQTQDITFKLYKAKFTTQSGSAHFTNPKLSDSNGYVPVLLDNPIETFPKTGTIGITTVTSGAISAKLVAGREVHARFSTSTAVIVGTGASVAPSGVSSIDGLGGTNYEDANNVDTFAITGKGSGLKLNITTTNGAIVSNPTVVQGGTGYQIGDIVGIVTSTVGTKGGRGEGARVSIASTGNIDTLFLTNIQADETSYAPNAGIAVTLVNDNLTTTTIPGSILSRSFDGGVNEGNVMKVNHFNHGMYSSSNKVVIENIQSDVAPTTLSDQLSRTETGSISVASTTNFDTFEGIPVSGTNIGYIKIGNEIIGYESVGVGKINLGSGTKRGIDNTIISSHEIGDVVRKHEISGVSLRRIQIENNVSSTPSPNIDDYHISFNRATNGKDRSSTSGDSQGIPELSFNTQSLVGGSNVRASQNILYSALIPRYNVLTPTGADGTGTSVNASIRTVSGTSVDGSESSFVDLGFESVQLNTLNPLDSVRLVASKQNEDQYLTGLPSNKSFTTIINLNSTDENLSPVIRLSSGSETEFISNRLNNPIGLDNYATDNRVDSITNDPHASSYVSNTISLSKPANSLKVLLSAFRPESSDFRVLYSLILADSSGVSQAFELFPGFNNVTKLDGDGFQVVDESKNDGRPDTLVTPSVNNQFKEYQFTADNLPEFIGFTIKIVMSGTNQARAPRIKELRAIAIK